MRNLLTETDRSWAERALAQSDELLLDHAHCEKKAAATAFKLLSMYPHYRFLQEPLSQVAREELEHFEQVLRILAERGVVYRSQTPSPYMKRLMEDLRRGEPARLVDRLLCCSLIEARSCERFRLLAKTAEDAELRNLYRDLLASEARHQQLYIKLACRVAPKTDVQARLTELARREAQILMEAPPLVRLHC